MKKLIYLLILLIVTIILIIIHLNKIYNNPFRFKDSIINDTIIDSNIDTIDMGEISISDSIFEIKIENHSIPKGYPLSKKYRISSKYGYRIQPRTNKRKFHSGIDIASPIGTPVIATADAKAIMLKDKYGALVLKLYHDSNYVSIYAHLSKFLIDSNYQEVKKGDTIGLSGNTGFTTGAHLHYAIQKDNKSLDPLLTLNPDSSYANKFN